MTPELLHAIRQQLRGDESPEEIAQLLSAAGLPAEIIPAVVQRLTLVVPPSGGDSAASTPSPSKGGTTSGGGTTNISPRLIVDWGTYPEVGHQARPHFLLYCSEAYDSSPEVRIVMDRKLDHDPDDLVPQPSFEEDRLWGFHVPFQLTTQGQDCRPGQYVIDLRVAFPDISTPGLPRCFRCSLRLKIQGPGSGRTLEIDGDGQSVVNLHGHDLTGFNRVVLKAGQQGIINLQNVASLQKAMEQPAAKAEAVAHEYSLKVDQEQERKLPRLSAVATRREPMEAAMLVFASGRRVIVLGKRQVKLGRNRDNDVILRFLPRNEQHDHWSKGLSRTHIVLDLTEAGLQVTDQSSTGLRVNGKPVDKEVLLCADRIGQANFFELGTSHDVERSFDLDVHLLRADERSGPASVTDETIARTIGAPLPTSWRIARAARIDAVRIRRKNNQSDEEYLLLFREALLRPSHDAPVVSLGGTQFETAAARLRYIDRVFWLENVAGSGSTSVRVDGHAVPPRELVPLAPGMTLTLGTEAIRFEKAEQMGLGAA